jgi:hypothetical protein
MTSENGKPALIQRTAIAKAAAQTLYGSAVIVTSIATRRQRRPRVIHNLFENKKKLFRAIISALTNDAVLLC